MKPTYFMSKGDFGTTGKSFIVFSILRPLEALNLIVESKSLPAEVNNSTIELHLPVERKKSLQSYSVGFDFLALQCELIRPLMIRCVTAPVSVKSQIHAIKTSHFHHHHHHHHHLFAFMLIRNLNTAGC